MGINQGHIKRHFFNLKKKKKWQQKKKLKQIWPVPLFWVNIDFFLFLYSLSVNNSIIVHVPEFFVFYTFHKLNMRKFNKIQKKKRKGNNS